jgi:hypothetical protein
MCCIALRYAAASNVSRIAIGPRSGKVFHFQVSDAQVL